MSDGAGEEGERLGRARSFLFVPGDRPERFDKALAAGSDVVVADLEDAVAPSAKDAALGHVVQLLKRVPDPGPGVMVRINDPRTARGRADLEALAIAGRPVGVLVAKAEEAPVLVLARDMLPAGSPVLPLVETARGVLDARVLAEVPGVVRLAFGHLDLCAELGLRPDDLSRLMPARFTIVAASAAAGLPAPIDGVCTEVRDADLVLDDARASLASGFTGKLCIHPSQILPVHRAFAPEPGELAWAHRILHLASEHEVRLVDGHMVDRPVFLRARAVVARAGNGG